MRIHIKDIRPEGISVAYEMTSAEVGLTDQDYLYFVGPLCVTARLERIENTVLAKVKVRGHYKSFCSRTLVNVERDWVNEFLLDFSVTPSTEYIDLNDDVRQEVILALPVKVLCDEEMKKERRAAPVEVEDELGPAVIREHKTYQPFADLKLKKE